MGKVYVVQQSPKKDISDAKRYGDIVYLLETPNRQAALDPHKFVSSISSRLVDYNPTEDYILPIGDPIAIGVVTAIAAEFGHSKVNLLYWDRRIEKYSPVLFCL